MHANHVSMNTNTIKLKDIEREKIRADIERRRNKGGAK